MIITRKTISIALLMIGVFSWANYASADVLGQSEKFFLNTSFSLNRAILDNTTLRHISERSYIYVADNYWNQLSESDKQSTFKRLEELGKEFDSRIYPIETSFFGSEPNPGIDSDPRIIISLSNLESYVGGYYDSSNQNLKSKDPNSNQKEILFINVSTLGENDLKKLKVFLAHEFQHLISFNQKELFHNTTDETWTNELRSEYAIQLLGYDDPYEESNLKRRVSAFEKNSYDSLAEWNNLEADYGHVALFGRYLAEHWSPQIVADTGKVSIAGIQSINASFARNGFLISFADAFKYWVLANTIDGKGSNSSLEFSNGILKNLKINPNYERANFDDTEEKTIIDDVKSWQITSYVLSDLRSENNNVFEIEFNSNRLNFFRIMYVTETAEGAQKIYELDTKKQNKINIPEIGKITKITIIPILETPDYTSSEVMTTYLRRIRAVEIDSSAVKEVKIDLKNNGLASTIPFVPILNNSTVKDGDLVRAKGNTKVYVVQGGWRRHIKSPAIFKFYPGWSFDKVIEVSPETLNGFRDTSLIRSTASDRVYEIDSLGVRHWLQMTEQQFIFSGRPADSIFNVNPRELSFYKLGNNTNK